MNAFELNSVELNGTGAYDPTVSIGLASATLTLSAFERISAYMSGTATLSFDVTADLTRFSQIGAGSAALNFGVAADLTRYTEKNIGTGSATLLLGATSALYTLVPLSDADATLEFTVAGSLAARGDLSARTTLIFDVTSAEMQRTIRLGSASAGISFAMAGEVTQYVKQFLPAAAATLELEAEAALTQYRYRQLPNASAPITFTATANLTAYRHAPIPRAAAGLLFTVNGALKPTIVELHGSVTLSFSATANLFNNPTADDPPAYLMTRPAVDRVMVR